MIVRHWCLTNGSGLASVAASLATAETARGLDSKIVDSMVESEAWEEALGADVHVVHSHLPTSIEDKLDRSGKKYKVVWVGHGTPDHVFQSAAEYAQSGGYGHPEPLMLMLHWLKRADARVTFWPRHQAMYQQMVDRGTVVHCLPLGVDTAFWGQGVTRGKFAGEPSVFTAENPHYIKWPYDLFVAWPWIVEQVPGRMAKLHAIYLPRDLHAVTHPWTFANGCAYYSYLSPITFDKEGLRNAFQSVDYVCGLVRYGDHNALSLQANAAGAKTISYRGNVYADYWITEGDQRQMATEIAAVLRGEVEPRSKTPVPDIAETAAGMHTIYEGLFA